MILFFFRRRKESRGRCCSIVPYGERRPWQIRFALATALDKAPRLFGGEGGGRGAQDGKAMEIKAADQDWARRSVGDTVQGFGATGSLWSLSGLRKVLKFKTNNFGCGTQIRRRRRSILLTRSPPPENHYPPFSQRQIARISDQDVCD